MKSSISILLILFCFGLTSCHNCGENEINPCGGSESMPMVDLIVLMDQSGSMNTAASAVSSAANQAIEEASKECITDLRVIYLGVEGPSFPGTLFTESQRNYITNIHGPSVALAADRAPLGFASEQGANAIEDLSQYFDWRENACRAIFYISDEELDGCCDGVTGLPARYDGTNPGELANEQMEVNLAIDMALRNEVTIFSHLLSQGGLHPDIEGLYQLMSDQTNGIHTKSAQANSELYLELLPEIICNSCNSCQLNNLIN